jgi:beta-N-acetylhexosaminidase
VKKALADLSATELAPFLDACRERIESLMSAHVLYPTLDARYPATLSRLIVTDLLRDRWGYGGVVFSDDLEMKAIAHHYSVEESAALAVEAGVDVILFTHDLDSARRALEFLCRRTEADPQLRSRVEQSYHRIAELKRRYLRSFGGVLEEEALTRHREIAERIQGSL